MGIMDLSQRIVGDASYAHCDYYVGMKLHGLPLRIHIQVHQEEVPATFFRFLAWDFWLGFVLGRLRIISSLLAMSI